VCAEKAKKSGLLALEEDLAALRDNSAFESLNRNTKLNTGIIAAQQRGSIIASSASKGSKGIRTTHLSSVIDKAQLKSREITLVHTDIDFEDEQDAAAVPRGPMRSIEDIQLVFDRYKGAVYAIYNRALRKDPQTENIPIIMISGNQQGTDQIWGTRLGANAFLPKPIDRGFLFSQLESLLNLQTAAV